jgi:hypothetical protein
MTVKSLMFEGLPVKEPKRPIRIVPTREDKKAAKRGDPACCVAAQCLKRTHALEDVRVYRSRVMTRPKGKNFWNRYVAPPTLSEEIRIFDSTGEFSGKSYQCNPLTPSKTSKGLAARNKVVRDRTSKSGKKPKQRRHASPMTKLRGSPMFQHAGA